MRWKILLIAVFAIVIAWFTLVNATQVSVNFLFVSATTSLVFVILISVLLGMSLMAVLWSARAWKMRRITKGLKQEVAALQDELSKAHQELADLHAELATEAEQAVEADDTGTQSSENEAEVTTALGQTKTMNEDSHPRNTEN